MPNLTVKYQILICYGRFIGIIHVHSLIIIKAAMLFCCKSVRFFGFYEIELCFTPIRVTKGSYMYCKWYIS